MESAIETVERSGTGGLFPEHGYIPGPTELDHEIS
jgi:hypothetical protein